MSPESTVLVTGVCESFGNDATRLLDILLGVEAELGYVGSESVSLIAERLAVPRVEVEGVVSFYSFLHSEPRGRVVIRLCDDVIDRLRGAERVAEGLEDELGIRFGETTADGHFSLERASCIGMTDQAPAALVNDVVVPSLSTSKARRGIQVLREKGDFEALERILIRDHGDGNNAHPLVRSAVRNNLRQPGPVIFGPKSKPGAALDRALAMSPAEVIRELKTARLRGRGGAGFPTGMKWEFARAAGGDGRFVICNADEGEPGTYKDRVILTERPDLVLEGMTVGGYAVGARQGILYLRGEYAYLRRYLEHQLEERRAAGLLGHDVHGKPGFDFDIRIQMGAGAYICGEETALINSLEGRRGDPRTRPPFPAQKGYMGRPTAVDNVETLCCVARILEMGSGWFSSMGTPASTGTKLLSISGDCSRHGIYEVPFGIRLREVLELCYADEPFAVQVGGASGQMVGAEGFDRRICFDDLATGGALMVLGKGRNVVQVAADYLRFFVHESCGYCTPCRVGNVLLLERVEKILAGKGEAADLDYLETLARSVKTTSRCGLGQTSPNPVLSTVENFRGEYEKLLIEPAEGNRAGFDLQAALGPTRQVTGADAALDSEEGSEV
jgi:[NiFe] hydrogenase diaphorase moiety large subunit